MTKSEKQEFIDNNYVITNDIPLGIEIHEGFSCVHFQITKQINTKEDPQLITGILLRKLYSEMLSYGIRPVFQLNSLRYANLDNKIDEILFLKTLKGIGDWSFALDIPVATCNVYFNNIYSDKPIINIIITGIIENNNRFTNSKISAGQEVLIISPDLNTKNEASPTYKDKLIMEAVMKCIKDKIVSGIWNTGGRDLLYRLKCITNQFNIGFKINYNKDFTIEDTTSSKNRFKHFSNKQILIVNKKDLKSVEKIFEHYDIQTINIGKVIKDSKIVIEDNKKNLQEIDIALEQLATNQGKPISKIKSKKNTPTQSSKSFDINDLEENKNYKKSAYKLLGNFNICSKAWIYKQFDAMSGIPEIFPATELDATIINLKQDNISFLIALEGNPQYFKYSTCNGAAIAIAEAARKIVCSGGIPSAITYNKGFCQTNTLNYSSELFENEINNAAQSLGLSAINIKSDFCNIESIKDKSFSAIEPEICVTGVLPNKENLMTMSFKQKGDLIYLIGEAKNDISSSQYLISEYDIQDSPAPYYDSVSEALLYESLTELTNKKIISSAHSISKGGLYTAIAESCFPNKLGFDITTDCEIRTDAFLFGESQGRVVVSVNPDDETAFIDYLVSIKIHFTLLGHVTKGSFRVNDEAFGEVKEAYNIYSQALKTKFNKVI